MAHTIVAHPKPAGINNWIRIKYPNCLQYCTRTHIKLVSRYQLVRIINYCLVKGFANL